MQGESTGPFVLAGRILSETPPRFCRRFRNLFFREKAVLRSLSSLFPMFCDVSARFRCLTRARIAVLGLLGTCDKVELLFDSSIGGIILSILPCDIALR